MSRAPQKGQKTAALYALHWLPRLAPSSRAVGAWLVWHANASSGRCDPGQARLREETGLSRRTIQTAVKELIDAGVVTRQLRGTASSSYQINWNGLAGLVSNFEARAKDNVTVVVPADRRKKLRRGGAESCASVAQETAPKHLEGTSVKQPVFRVGTLSDETDDPICSKLLAIKADAAFLAALDREVQKGRLFHPAAAERVYARLETIQDGTDARSGDPVGGRALRLLETNLNQKVAW